MQYIAKCYQREDDILRQAGFSPGDSVITGIEFNPESREIHYIIRSASENPIASESKSCHVVRRFPLVRK